MLSFRRHLALAILPILGALHCGPASSAGDRQHPGSPGATGVGGVGGTMGPGQGGAAGIGTPPATAGTGAAAGTAGTAGSGGTGFSGAPGGGTAGTTAGDECTDVVDVVFVLDLSSSMMFVLQKLSQEIHLVVDAASKLAPFPHFGLVAFVDNHRLDLGGPGGSPVHVDPATLANAFNFYLSSYMLFDRNPGDDPVAGPTQQNPICEENSLDALHAAAVEFPWRPNATRVVIVATDDTFIDAPDNYGDRDGDGQTNQTDFPSEGNYPALHSYDETVGALVGGKIRVFSFTRVAPPAPFDPFGCGTGRRRPANEVPNGWAQPHAGKAAIPMATDGESFDLGLVQANQLSLATTINQIVLDSHCRPVVN